MLKTVLASLSMTALLFTGSSQVSQPTLAADEREVGTSSIVQVLCLEGSGSAVHVGDGKYATARHVITMSMCTVQGEAITNLRLSSDEKDFGTFHGPKISTKMKFSCSGFTAGKDYLAIGYAFGLPRLTANPWKASPFRVGWHNAFTGESIPGMSGGPVIDEKGTVIGVVNMRWPARSIALKYTEMCK